MLHKVKNLKGKIDLSEEQLLAPEEVFSHENTKWEDFFYGLKRWLKGITPRSIYRRLKWFVQKNRKGYSDYDLWDMFSWHTNLMIGALEDFKRLNVNSIPTEFTDQDGNEYFNDLKVDGLTWSETLDVIIDGFKAAKQLEELTFQDDELKQIEKRFHRGFRKFHRWYFHLWD